MPADLPESLWERWDGHYPLCEMGRYAKRVFRIAMSGHVALWVKPQVERRQWRALTWLLIDTSEI
jgi:hypothetical protein